MPTTVYPESIVLTTMHPEGYEIMNSLAEIETGAKEGFVTISGKHSEPPFKKSEESLSSVKVSNSVAKML